MLNILIKYSQLKLYCLEILKSCKNTESFCLDNFRSEFLLNLNPLFHHTIE